MIRIRKTAENDLALQSLLPRDRPPTTPRPTPLEAGCAVAGNTFRCVPPVAARKNRIRDARGRATNRNHHLRVQADDRSLHCATLFRSPRLRPRDKYGTFRFQTCGTRGATSLERDTVHNALPFPWPAQLPDLPLYC